MRDKSNEDNIDQIQIFGCSDWPDNKNNNSINNNNNN